MYRLLTLRALLAGAALLALGAAATARPSDRDDGLFKRYTVAEVYRGPVHFPDFRKQDHAFSLFRTRIREGMAHGANFAGHYALVGWGCGAECVSYVVGDVASGRVFKFPLGGEETLELRLETRPASRAIIARWVAYTDKQSRDDLPIMHCLRQDFVWNGASAVPLSKPVLVASVKSTDLDQCDN